MSRRLLAALTALIAVVPSIADAGVQTRVPSVASAPRWVADEALVAFARGTDAAARTRILRDVGATPIREIAPIGVWHVALPAGSDVLDVTTRLAASPRVRFAEPNRTGTIAGELLPNDRCFGGGCGVGRLWNLDAINAPAGWATFPGQFYSQAERAALDPVKIAVLDTKIALDRADWRNADAGSTTNAHDARSGGQIDVADAADLLSNQQFTGPADYHGTFVASILGASANNSTDVAGVAFHAQLMPVTVVDGSGVVTAADLATGIGYAVSRGAKVINLSLVMADDSDTVRAAVAAAASKAILVAAAGNAGSDAPTYPAWYSGVLSVAATTIADRRASCSNRSARTSVAAPGSEVIGLDPRAGSFAGLSKAGCGTSTAAPHVAGLAALLIAKYPAWSIDKVRLAIEQTADDDAVRPGYDPELGYGRINVERALAFGSGRPEVLAFGATIPAGSGGLSTISAFARSGNSEPILEARGYLGRVGADAPVNFTATDGAFDALDEPIRAEVETTLGMSAGVTRVYVQARTASGWGPFTSGALVIDRGMPTVRVQGEGPFVSVPAANLPGVVTVSVSDDYSLNGTAQLVVSRAFGDGSVVYRSASVPVSFPGNATLRWSPAIGDSGHYRVKIYVIDAAGNPASTTTDLIVL